MRTFTLLFLTSFALQACESPPADTPPAAQIPVGIPGNSAVYIAMPDGTRIAVDIFLPENAGPSHKIPALVNITRYWRQDNLDPPPTNKSDTFTGINNAGYALVLVDTRGSGASFGTRGTEFSTCETADFKHLLDWVAEQPWSNGKLATFGVSYDGNTAEHATFDPSTALKAAVPRFTDFDAYRSILFPGGLTNLLITSNWAAGVRSLDLNQVPQKLADQEGPTLLGVKPVDGDIDQKLLKLAVAEHADNVSVDAAFSKADYRDEIGLASSLSDPCDQAVSPFAFQKQVETNKIPSFHWGSWMDAGTAAGVLARFASYDAPGKYIIGAWSHGAHHDADPFNPKDTLVNPGVAEQYSKIFEFLAPFTLAVKQTADSPDSVEAILEYFTMGQGKWKQTNHWPPANSTSRILYLSQGSSLNWAAGSGTPTQYTVNFEIGSGSSTRWSTQLGGTDVYYGNRAGADADLATFTSPPLEKSLEITGNVVIDLYLSSTHEDGAVIAYLEAVAPSGVVTMITEGELRLIHRKISDHTPPYPVFGPYHSFEKRDASPMPVGQVQQVSFVLLPTSVEIPAGYALRIAIAGHDKDSFARFPKEGTPTLTIHHDKKYPSHLRVPVVLAQVDNS